MEGGNQQNNQQPAQNNNIEECELCCYNFDREIMSLCLNENCSKSVCTEW